MKADALAVLIALVSGSAMSVAVSGVWVALNLPARLQERFGLTSSWPMTFALCSGLILASVGVADGSLYLPQAAGCLALLCGGIFVGMLSSALGEVLQVVPVLAQRLRLTDRPFGYRLALMVGKGVGAILAALMVTG